MQHYTDRFPFFQGLDKYFLEALRIEMPFENEVVTINTIKLHMGGPKNHLKAEEVERFF